MSGSSLVETLQKFRGLPILVVGDLMLDEYIWGSVDRISPEAPVVVVKVREESIRAGGAGNVAANISELGGEALIVGLVGDDLAGEKILARLESRGVDTSLVVRSKKFQTIRKTRVVAHGQQVVRVDRESSEHLDEETLGSLADNFSKALALSSGVVVSDYGKGVWGRETYGVLRSSLDGGLVQQNNIKVVIDPKPRQTSHYGGAWIMTPNRKESEEISGMIISSIEDAVAAGEKIAQEVGVNKVLVTLGDKGMVLVDRDNGFEGAVDTVAQRVFDVSGAGDTVCATLCLGLAAGEDAFLAAQLANVAAGVVVGEVGTVAVTREKLLAALEHV